MTIEDDIAFLARVPTFAKFGFAALQIVAIGSESRHLADGEILFSAGDTTDAGYVIQTGALTLAANDPRLSETAVTFGPGTLLGELALVTETVCSTTAVATEQTTVMRISRNLFRKVLEGFPEAAAVMHDRLMIRVNQSNAELVRIRGMLEKRPSRNAAPENASTSPSRGRPPGDLALGASAPGDLAPKSASVRNMTDDVRAPPSPGRTRRR